jgi:hypothetical protein
MKRKEMILYTYKPTSGFFYSHLWEKMTNKPKEKPKALKIHPKSLHWN